VEVASPTPLASGPKLLAVYGDGRIGSGRERLACFTDDGQIEWERQLPDRASQVRASSAQILAGCRNGYLYSFDLDGNLTWQFLIPASDRERGAPPTDRPSDRPCPYFLSVSPEGERVLCNSFDRLFMLDAEGHLLWRWRTTTVVLSSRRSALVPDPDAPGGLRRVILAPGQAEPIGARLVITGSRSMSAPSISGIAVAPRGSASVVASYGRMAWLDRRGREVSEIAVEGGVFAFDASTDLARLVCGNSTVLRFYHGRKLVRSVPVDGFHRVQVRSDGEQVVAWYGARLLAFRSDGELLCEIATTKPITDAALTDAGLVLAADWIFRLSFMR